MKFMVEIPDQVMAETTERAKEEGMTGTPAEIVQYELVNSLVDCGTEHEIQRMYRLVNVTQM
jgi:hypothetical protein